MDFKIPLKFEPYSSNKQPARAIGSVQEEENDNTSSTIKIQIDLEDYRQCDWQGYFDEGDHMNSFEILNLQFDDQGKV